MIDEKKLIEEIKSMVRSLLTPDGTAWFDEAIQAHNETIVDVLNAIEQQPKVGEWIPIEVARPAECEHVQVSYIDYNTGECLCDGIAYLYNGLWYWQDFDPEYGEPVCVESDRSDGRDDEFYNVLMELINKHFRKQVKE